MLIIIKQLIYNVKARRSVIVILEFMRGNLKFAPLWDIKN